MLRHAAASLLSAAGVPIEDSSDTLGHRSVAVTAEIYRPLIAPICSGHRHDCPHSDIEIGTTTRQNERFAWRNFVRKSSEQCKHGSKGLDALTQLPTGNPWQPQTT